jgi:CBS domain-containing protein
MPLKYGRRNHLTMGISTSLDRPVSEFVSKGFVSVPSGSDVVTAAVAMKQSGTTEVIVVKGDVPVGIVTERDILYKVVAPGRVPRSVKVDEIMSSPIQTIESDSKAAEAIATMSRLGVRRLAVTSRGRIVGIVTQKSIVSGKLGEQVPLPELATPGRLSCPYCGETMEDAKTLSRHIDQVHIGRGLLQGDVRKW